MVYFMKPTQWLAKTLCLTALIFYVIALSSAGWFYVDNAGSNFSYGPFRACGRVWSYQIDECRRLDNDCTADFSAPLGNQSILSSCDRLRAVRALGLIALFSTLFALIPMMATACITHDLALRLISSFWSFLAGVTGLISWAIFCAQDLPSRALYGYAFALMAAAWILNFIHGVITLFPSPVTLPATAEMVKGQPGYVGQDAAAYGAYPPTARPSLSHNAYPVQSVPVATTQSTYPTGQAPAALV